VYVVGHRDCGMSKVTPSSIVPKMINQFGISRQSLLTLQYSGTDVATWMAGFESVDDGVLFSVDILRNHPLCPLSITLTSRSPKT
jgi:carbonic anhydrase